jgi:hypothetical protein
MGFLLKCHLCVSFTFSCKIMCYLTETIYVYLYLSIYIYIYIYIYIFIYLSIYIYIYIYILYFLYTVFSQSACFLLGGSCFQVLLFLKPIPVSMFCAT